MTHELNKLMTKNDCCGGPAPKQIDACCVDDAEAKASGKKGCGCDVQTSSGPDQKVDTGCCN